MGTYGHVKVPQALPAAPVLGSWLPLPSTLPDATATHQTHARGGGLLLGEPKLRALGVLRLRPLTLAVKGTSSSRGWGSSSLGEAIRHTYVCSCTRSLCCSIHTTI